MKKEDKKKWVNISIPRADFMLCRVIADASRQSTSAFIHEMILAGLSEHYGDVMKTARQKVVEDNLRVAKRAS